MSCIPRYIHPLISHQGTLLVHLQFTTQCSTTSHHIPQLQPLNQDIPCYSQKSQKWETRKFELLLPDCCTHTLTHRGKHWQDWLRAYFENSQKLPTYSGWKENSSAFLLINRLQLTMQDRYNGTWHVYHGIFYKKQDLTFNLPLKKKTK